MPRRPTIPTLFPYTTLFRSQNVQGPGKLLRINPAQIAGGHFAAREIAEIAGSVAGIRDCDIAKRGSSATHQLQHLPSFARYRDRKSTRLNSSHLGISYAVFC